jgi:hypothetical protein
LIFATFQGRFYLSQISELYAEMARQAREATMTVLCPELGEFVLTGWIPGTFEKIWHPTEYPWEMIRKIYIEPDRLELALWSEESLVALGICQTKDESLFVRVIEGPRVDTCPFAGQRAFILADAATRYAQLRGKRLIQLQPATPELINLYVQGCGFSPPDPASGSQYYWKKVKP